MIRTILVVIAVLSPFFFPWPFSLALSFIASFFVPFSGVLTGLIADSLYYSNGLPWATLTTLALALVAYGVRAFAKARIIGA